MNNIQIVIYIFFSSDSAQILKIEELNHQIVELNKKKDSENLECNRLNHLLKVSEK